MLCWTLEERRAWRANTQLKVGRRANPHIFYRAQNTVQRGITCIWCSRKHSSQEALFFSKASWLNSSLLNMFALITHYLAILGLIKSVDMPTFHAACTWECLKTWDWWWIQTVPSPPSLVGYRAGESQFYQGNLFGVQRKTTTYITSASLPQDQLHLLCNRNLGWDHKPDL